MAKNVCIVESPTKIPSVSKYLGNDFEVLASFGHIRDLPAKNGSVDTNNNFSMIWDLDDRGAKSLSAIEKALKKAETLYLATDPDREGEAISWHVVDALKAKGALAGKDIKRIVFNEITKTAVQEAVKHPRDIYQPLVDAYLARRALDYLVGFNLSPVLWRKLPGAKSAGRVQSVALRIIVEREEEIERFDPQEYWTVEGSFLSKDGKPFKSNLTHLNGKKLTKFDLNTEILANNAVKAALEQIYSVTQVEKKQIKRNPTPPFTTSTLQQEASRKLGFGAKRTMQTAQKLYEGFSIKGELTGLITYMRTDSVNLSNDALSNLRDFIGQQYGKPYLPDAPRHYKNKSKNAQEAHEAIRPTDISRTPNEVSAYLDEGQLKLYTLIWKRAVACQMESAIFDQVGVDITSADKKIIFRSTGSTLVFDGFLKVYQEGKDDEDDDEDAEKRLPVLTEGDKTDLENVTPAQHFTQPPPRFSEASLIKKLEELGIGRPSTYTSIISVLQERQYVKLDKKQFIPEDRGRIVIAFLKHHFLKYVSYDFTANLEEQLDDIANGDLRWLDTMKSFWTDFSSTVDGAMTLSIADVISEVEEDMAHYLFKGKPKAERVCPSCSKGEIHLKLSRFGAFLGCSAYPDCNYTQQFVSADGQNDEYAPNFEPQYLGEDPKTNQKIHLKKGPYGFYAEWDLIEKEKKPKRVSIPASTTPDQVTLQSILDLGALPKLIGESDEYGKLKVGIGRFGPYVQWKDGFVSIPKAEDPMTLKADRAIELIIAKLAKPPSTRGRKFVKKPATKKTTAKKSSSKKKT